MLFFLIIKAVACGTFPFGRRYWLCHGIFFCCCCVSTMSTLCVKCEYQANHVGTKPTLWVKCEYHANHVCTMWVPCQPCVWKSKCVVYFLETRDVKCFGVETRGLFLGIERRQILKSRNAWLISGKWETPNVLKSKRVADFLETRDANSFKVETRGLFFGNERRLMF